MHYISKFFEFAPFAPKTHPPLANDLYLVIFIKFEPTKVIFALLVLKYLSRLHFNTSQQRKYLKISL